jgi:hypothetical protein
MVTLGKVERRGQMIYGEDEGPGTAPFIADCVDMESAELITRAVNSFAAMLNALRAASLEMQHNEDCENCPACEVEAALALAEGKAVQS